MVVAPTHTPYSKGHVQACLEQVPDPEIPVLSILDLGMVADIEVDDLNKNVTIHLMPTYSACPAVDVIAADVKKILQENGYGNVAVKQVLQPAWTTDFMTEKGKAKLEAYGIAPPHQTNNPQPVSCPQCGAQTVTLRSQFGSTACKALYQCDACKEPFDAFKCH